MDTRTAQSSQTRPLSINNASGKKVNKKQRVDNLHLWMVLSYKFDYGFFIWSQMEMFVFIEADWRWNEKKWNEMKLEFEFGWKFVAWIQLTYCRECDETEISGVEENPLLPFAKEKCPAKYVADHEKDAEPNWHRLDCRTSLVFIHRWIVIIIHLEVVRVHLPVYGESHRGHYPGRRCLSTVRPSCANRIS